MDICNPVAGLTSHIEQCQKLCDALDDDHIGRAQHIVDLMRANIHVAIVTAAGYPGEAERFEQRVAGLLDAFRFLRLPDSVTSRYALRQGAGRACHGSAESPVAAL